MNHPRVHISVECPKYSDAKTVYDRLRRTGLRSERLAYRSGTDIEKPQIVKQ